MIQFSPAICVFRERFGYFEYAPSNVRYDVEAERYFRDVLTDPSIRQTFQKRFPHLLAAGKWRT